MSPNPMLVSELSKGLEAPLARVFQASGFLPAKEQSNLETILASVAV